MNKCGKKGPIFPTQESQIIYVNALLPGSETWLTPFEVQRIGLSISLPLKRVWKKNQLADTTSTKRSRIKLPFISHVLIMCPNYDMRDAVTQCEGHATSVTFSPSNPNSSWKKHQTNPKWEKFCVISDQYSLKWSRSWKQDQTEKLFRPEKTKK